jgi:hypothetical protein
MAPDFGKQRPEAARRFPIAYLRGSRIQSLMAHTPVRDPALYDVIGLPSFDPNDSVDPTASWGLVQDYFVQQGLQQKKIDISTYLDSTTRSSTTR